MMRSNSPATRPSSPAMSEISVGSPSPPPRDVAMSLYHATAFRPLNMKRMRLAQYSAAQPPPFIAAPPTTRRKSNVVERVKSFSIADILGRSDKTYSPPPQPAVHEPTVAAATSISSPQPAITPSLQPANATQLLNNRLQAPPTTQLLLDAPAAVAISKVPVVPWDPVRGPIPMRPFFPPALLHYEQRLAWDYQRQLQEHFQAQAQLLRQMSMDPTIIPSEDGSERSRSSSTGSDCYSPDVDVSSGSVGPRTDEKSDGGACELSSQNACSSSAGENIKKMACDTPLDALFQLSTKNFDEEQDPATLNIFATRPNPKKKRKSRTAFTNHQIFELERRFLYQKYLSPADRDEIAAGLGLSNAQVITWFQNRRAKLKRDMEELKKDVESVKQLSAEKSFLENVNDLSILKTRPVSRHQQQLTPEQQQQQPQAASATAPGNAQHHVSSCSSLKQLISSSASPPHPPAAASIDPPAATTAICAATDNGSGRSASAAAAEAPSQQQPQLYQQQSQRLQLHSGRG